MSIDEAEAVTVVEYISTKYQRHKYDESRMKYDGELMRQLAHVCASPYMKKDSSFDGIFVLPWDKPAEKFALPEEQFKKLSNHLVNALNKRK